MIHLLSPITRGVVILVLACLAGASAAEPKATKTKTKKFLIDRVLAKAQRVGRPALIVYSKDDSTCPISLSAVKYMSSDPTVRKVIGRRYVIAYIPFKDASPRYKAYRQRFPGFVHPFWVVTDPDGNFLAGGDYNTVKDRRKWLTMRARESSKYPTLKKAQTENASTQVDQARKSVEAGDLSTAKKALQSAKGVWYPRTLVNGSALLKKELDSASQSALAEAEALQEKGQSLEAAVKYHQVFTALGMRDAVGKSAAKKLFNLKNSTPELKKTLPARLRTLDADRKMAAAKLLETSGETNKARLAYRRLTRSHKGTDSAELAQQAYDRLEEQRKAEKKK
jgi:hypothetical protein